MYDQNILVSGQSRSGKTVWLTSLLISLCHFSDPEYLRICIADPKYASFKGMEGVYDVARSYEEITAMIDTLIEELKERKQHVSTSSFSTIRKVNEYAYKSRNKSMLRPYIVCIFDEFADYIEECKAKESREKEEKKKNKDTNALSNIDKLHKLVATGLSNGIHFVLATQAPYKEVVKGLIKNNLSRRISFLLGGEEQDRVALGVRHKDDRRTIDLTVGKFLQREKGRRVLYKGVNSTDKSVPHAVARWKQAKLSWKLKPKAKKDRLSD